MCTRYYFVSSKANERDGSYLMVSTSKDINHAKKIAKSRFKSYGYKGKVVNIHSFSDSIGKAIAI